MNWEFYGDVVMYAGGVLENCISGILFWRFVKPFLRSEKQTWMVGITYALVMLALRFYPYEVDNKICYGIGVTAVFLVMYWLDRRNPEQKVFLAVTFYLLEWIAWGVILGPWDMMYHVIVMRSPFIEFAFRQWALWLVMEILFVSMDISAKGLLIKVIHRAYHYKQENMTKREFALLLAPSMSVVAGYWISSYFCNIYEMDSGQYMYDIHQEYIWFRALYMAVSFAALLTVIISYQHIKDGQRKEKEEAILSRQMEDMKRHLNEVERLYVDIRSLKHDMANHVMVLESIYGQARVEEEDEKGEFIGKSGGVKDGGSSKIGESVGKSEIAGKYMAQLKKHVEKTILEISSGNPITDVILREKCDEAAEKGISFCCEFHYPAQTKVDAFDVSIILNNALNNAMEAAGECENPFVLVKSYQMRNAWMIEIRNSMMGLRAIDEESGLPKTAKKGAGHGFGLVSIQKVAQRYNGDIDISQEGREFVLSVMLMIV